MFTPLQKRDLDVLWHPCSQMKDYESFPPIEIESAKGSHLFSPSGKSYIDAISSWWCKSYGHRHPTILKGIQDQMEKFDHIILANTTNETIVQLSEKLTSLSPNLDKVFYAGDGSSALEIALKMSFHAQHHLGRHERKQFMGLENGYHGETLLTLGISDLGLYKKPYDKICSEALYLKQLPYVSGKNDPLFRNCESVWGNIEEQLLKVQHKLASIVLEPMIQGAGGMLILSADFLKRLRKFCTQHNIYLIADEIMTGFGRTGKMLATEWADIEADFVCLSKGLTGGSLPMSAMLTKNEIYDLFYGNYDDKIAFLHSNTHCGNALAAAAALASFKVVEEEDIIAKANLLGDKMKESFDQISKKTQRLTNIRQLGAMVAADLILEPEQENERLGYQIYQEAVKQGALLRPLGNTIYWLPPLTTDLKTIDELEAITSNAIQTILH